MFPSPQVNMSPADGVVSQIEVFVGSNMSPLKTGVYRAVAGEPECTFQLIQEVEFPAGTLAIGYNMVRCMLGSKTHVSVLKHPSISEPSALI